MMHLRILFVFLLLIACQKNENPVALEQAQEKLFKNAAVVSAHPLATQVGVDILKSGGNAFDATVAVQFALAVVYPIAGNLGGGGFAVFVDTAGNTGSLDYREKAPASAHRDIYLDSAGNVIKGASTMGVLSAAVPGTVQGMWDLHQKYGNLKWSELIQPSIDISRNGWVLTKKEASALNRYNSKLDSINAEGSYLTEKSDWKEGDSLVNENLALTLERIRDHGPEGFYQGATAELIIQSMKKHGGIISKEDLNSYSTIWREPLEGDYKGYKIVSMSPPSSGGIALLSMLKMVENDSIRDWGRWNSKTLHLMAEIEKRVYADRSEYLGDPDFYEVPVDDLLDIEYIMSRDATINMDSATPSEYIKPGLEAIPESEETTHYSIIDEQGNAVSVTTTLNGAYGSKLVVEGAGFLLNNEMDDFSVKPGYPNLYGLIGGEANAIEPGKRMLSSMTPTIVMENDKVKFVVGSPGGSTIITTVFQNVLNVIDFDMSAQESVNAPRFHHQWLPDSLYYEDGFWDYADSISLSQFKQNLQNREPIGRVNAIAVDKSGILQVGADPRGDDFGDGY